MLQMMHKYVDAQNYANTVLEICCKVVWNQIIVSISFLCGISVRFFCCWLNSNKNEFIELIHVEAIRSNWLYTI